MTLYYLAGPMTGYPRNNADAFDAAAERLRAEGFEVISPSEMDREAGWDGVNQDTLPPLKDLARLDINAILQVDAVAVMDGWEKSKGTNLEIAIARWLEIPVVKASDLTPLEV